MTTPALRLALDGIRRLGRLCRRTLLQLGEHDFDAFSSCESRPAITSAGVCSISMSGAVHENECAMRLAGLCVPPIRHALRQRRRWRQSFSRIWRLVGLNI
jgi:hypothetical protein